MTSCKNIRCVKPDELKMRDEARFLGRAGPISKFVCSINQTSNGIKACLVSEYKSGYMFNMYVYTGKSC